MGVFDWGPGIAPGSYHTVLVDPPWQKTDAGHNARPVRFAPGGRGTSTQTDNRGRVRRYRSKIKIEDHYPTMSHAQLLDLPVGDLASSDAHLWCWSMNSTMEQAYRLVRAWGFSPLNVVTWRKGSYGLGFYMRNNTEQLIFAVRGKSLQPESAWMGTCIEAPRKKHSQKPPISIELIEHVSPGPRVELFARSPRLGWDAWGNEI